MNYIFYAAKTVNLKACVTKFLRHICLLSLLPLSAWEIPERNTQNPVSFGCPFQSFENVIVLLSSGFYFSEALTPLLHVQSSECACWVPPISSLPSFLGCWFPLTGSALPMDFWSWLPQFLDGTHMLLPVMQATSTPMLIHAQYTNFWHSAFGTLKNLSHIKIFPWKPKQRGTKRLHVSFSLVVGHVPSCFMSALQCGIFILSLRQVSLEIHPFPFPGGGKHGTQPLLAFLIGFRPQGSSSSSEDRSLFKI